MREITTTLQIDKAGRINIPKYIRDALELKGSDLVKVTLAKETLEGKQGTLRSPCLLRHLMVSRMSKTSLSDNSISALLCTIFIKLK